MTREEYKQAVLERWPAFEAITKLLFPHALTYVARQLFIEQDLTSLLAQETLRRAKQLEATGITDP